MYLANCAHSNSFKPKPLRGVAQFGVSPAIEGRRTMNQLVLPKTKLTFADGRLVKLGGGQSVLATFDTKDILSFRIERTKDYPFPVALCLGLIAMMVVARTYIESAGWSWTATIVCGVMAVFAIMMIDGRKIVVETTHGAVGFLVTDQFDHAEAFVLAVCQHLTPSQASNGHISERQV